MGTHNKGFYEDLTKLSLNYHQILSNTHLISFADSPVYVRPGRETHKDRFFMMRLK